MCALSPRGQVSQVNTERSHATLTFIWDTGTTRLTGLDTARNFSVREARRKFTADGLLCNTANVSYRQALNKDLQAIRSFKNKFDGRIDAVCVKVLTSYSTIQTLISVTKHLLADHVE